MLLECKSCHNLVGHLLNEFFVAFVGLLFNDFYDDESMLLGTNKGLPFRTLLFSLLVHQKRSWFARYIPMNSLVF